MPIFKTMSEVLTPWFIGTEVNELPLKEEWLPTHSPGISDIDNWEQIYIQSGNIGVYAAWSPYVELYIIVHDLFVSTDYGVEVFSSSDSVSNRLKEFDIVLPTNLIWI